MIPLTHDGEAPGETAENCCFCYARTRYWYAKKDVAVCQTCAAKQRCKDVPDKKTWMAAVRAKFPFTRWGAP